MATTTTTVDSPTLSSTEPTNSESIPPVIDKSPTSPPQETDQETVPPPPKTAEERVVIPPLLTQNPSRSRRESHISEIDPNAFKIIILLASSGYRTQISVNRSFLEKASSVEGEEFLVSQLKTAIWKDWPSGTNCVVVKNI